METRLIVLNPFEKKKSGRLLESKWPRAQVERLLSVSHCEASQL